jgi:hypothetical protein
MIVGARIAGALSNVVMGALEGPTHTANSVFGPLRRIASMNSLVVWNSGASAWASFADTPPAHLTLVPMSNARRSRDVRYFLLPCWSKSIWQRGVLHEPVKRNRLTPLINGEENAPFYSVSCFSISHLTALSLRELR